MEPRARGTQMVWMLCAVTLVVVVWAQAGPLDPPPGPVAPTMKTLAEVEPRTPISALPFTISQPGSYYLTGDLLGVAAQNGITITASDVTLDLRGFALRGVSGSQDGICVSGPRKNITIMNGTITMWSQKAINASTATKSMVLYCKIPNPTGPGPCLGDQGTYSYVSVTECSGDGMTGSSNCKVENSSSGKNTGKGIVVGPGSTVTFCQASTNGADGISAGDRSSVESCNSTSNAGAGIAVGSGGLVARCASTSNGGDGILAAPGSSVTECTTRTNGGDGIEVASDCYVCRNTCGGNGVVAIGAGIIVMSSDNRIEENNVTDNDFGIVAVAPGGGSLIIRNSASGNTTADYNVASTNSVGPIVTVTGVPIPATVGPWANFIF